MILALIQARMGSTRFPGKTLAELSGHPMLWHVVHRARQAKRVDKVVVATTDHPSDDPIAAFCQSEQIDCFRGSEQDVLDRFYQAAKLYGADTVVRITADCPLIDASVIDKVIARFQQGDCDYACNILRYTYPDGLDVEVFSFDALELSWKESTNPADREHVTLYLLNRKFRAANVESDFPVSPGEFRWTVDYPSDLEFVSKIYSELSSKGEFDFRVVLHLLKERPDLAATQTNVISNEGYYLSLYEQAKAGPAPRRPISQSQAWFARSRNSIPGSSQTFSKGPTQFVQGVAPIFLQRGKGSRAWDVDGNEYIDYIQGLLPNILGYAHDEVNQAAMAQIAEGHSFSLPHPLEVQLAERLKQLIPCAEMVRFGKNGSDVTAGAIRAARAFTGRERVACCGYHGWQDWYIGSTTRNAGVPAAVCALTQSFRYNDLSSLEQLLSSHPGEFAAVIMEPTNFEKPAPGFLEGVKELAHKHGALLIFDEICTGFRFGLGGAQKLFGVTPDLAAFGKAMGNGFPISCVLGRADVMAIFTEIFYSFTFAGEVASMAAALKVLDILEHTDTLARIEANGITLQDAVNVMSAEAGLKDRVSCIGWPAWTLIQFTKPDGSDDSVLKDLFQQEAIKRGILIHTTHNLSGAHDNADIQQTLESYAEIFKTLGNWISEPNLSRFLEGEPTRPVFKVR